MDRFRKEEYRRLLVRRIKRKQKEDQERRNAYYGSRKNRLHRWSMYVFESIGGNLHDACQNFTTTVAENLLKICYGILMLTLFFCIALYLLHNVKSVWFDQPSQQATQ